MWHATWQKLYSQQLQRGQNHANSMMKWGQGSLSNKKKFARTIFNFFFAGTKTKTRPN